MDANELMRDVFVWGAVVLAPLLLLMIQRWSNRRHAVYASLRPTIEDTLEAHDESWTVSSDLRSRSSSSHRGPGICEVEWKLVREDGGSINRERFEERTNSEAAYTEQRLTFLHPFSVPGVEALSWSMSLDVSHGLGGVVLLLNEHGSPALKMRRDTGRLCKALVRFTQGMRDSSVQTSFRRGELEVGVPLIHGVSSDPTPATTSPSELIDAFDELVAVLEEMLARHVEPRLEDVYAMIEAGSPLVDELYLWLMSHHHDSVEATQLVDRGEAGEQPFESLALRYAMGPWISKMLTDDVTDVRLSERLVALSVMPETSYRGRFATRLIEDVGVVALKRGMGALERSSRKGRKNTGWFEDHAAWQIAYEALLDAGMGILREDRWVSLFDTYVEHLDASDVWAFVSSRASSVPEPLVVEAIESAIGPLKPWLRLYDGELTPEFMDALIVRLERSCLANASANKADLEALCAMFVKRSAVAMLPRLEPFRKVRKVEETVQALLRNVDPNAFGGMTLSEEIPRGGLEVAVAQGGDLEMSEKRDADTFLDFDVDEAHTEEDAVEAQEGAL